MMKLYDFQEQGVQQIKAAPLNRWILAYDTGLGKTPTAVTACREIGWEKVLIVAPAIAREVWAREMTKWWPEHPTVGNISLGKSRKAGVSKKGAVRREAAYSSPYQVVSYDLAGEVSNTGWDAIIIDELHRLQSPMSQQSTTVRSIVRANPGAGVLGLTATLMPNEIIDSWNPLDTIWEERFGKRNQNGRGCWAFNKRYSNLHTSEYGRWFSGINQQHASELRLRLGAVSHRVTKSQVRHLLPALNVSLLPVDGPRGNTDSRAKDLLSGRGESRTAVESALSAAGKAKREHVIEWAQDRRASQCCILTHLRESAEAIAQQLAAVKRPVFLVTGDDPVETRHELIEQARDWPGSVLVATMHSVGISIDLTFCTEVLFAELYYRPETMIQALGRFQRLSGYADCNIYIMVLKHTIDEVIGEALLEKIEAISQAITAGDNDKKLLSALQGPEMSDAELFASIADMLAVKSEDWLLDDL